MRKKLFAVFRFLLILAGAGALAYPYVSEKVNELHMSRAIAGYSEAARILPEEDYRDILEQAREYNRALAKSASQYAAAKQLHESYEICLNVSGDGVMGYIEIPSISVRLPVYHGTDGVVLQIAAGHMEGSSLPVGGESTHSVITGHTGMNGASLFTRLMEMREGDVFYLHMLNETCAYRVYSVETVLPEKLESLRIEEGKDRCTLVTCTPYGINSHRLLVHGERTEADNTAPTETAQSIPERVVEKTKVMNTQDRMFLGCIGVILAALIIRKTMDLFRERRRKRAEDDGQKGQPGEPQ